MPDYREWLEKGLSKPGVDAQKVAAALGKHHSVVYKLLDGNRKFHVDDLPKIASAIGEPMPIDGEAIMPTRAFSYRKYVTLNVSGIVSAGNFSVPKRASSEDVIVVFRDKEFPKVQHMAFGVTGKQLEHQKIFDGDRLFCIDYEAIGGFKTVREGTPIVVERTRNGTRELAIKIAALTDASVARQSKLAINIAKSDRASGNGATKSATVTVRVLSVVRMVTRTLL